MTILVLKILQRQADKCALEVCGGLAQVIAGDQTPDKADSWKRRAFAWELWVMRRIFQVLEEWIERGR